MMIWMYNRYTFTVHDLDMVSHFFCTFLRTEIPFFLPSPGENYVPSEQHRTIRITGDLSEKSGAKVSDKQQQCAL